MPGNSSARSQAITESSQDPFTGNAVSCCFYRIIEPLAAITRNFVKLL